MKSSGKNNFNERSSKNKNPTFICYDDTNVATPVQNRIVETLRRLMKERDYKNLSEKAEQVNKICSALLTLICKAETFSHYSGIEKKEFVMTKANQFALENRFVFDYDFVSEKIEELLQLTREVNNCTRRCHEEKKEVSKKIIISA